MANHCSRKYVFVPVASVARDRKLSESPGVVKCFNFIFHEDKMLLQKSEESRKFRTRATNKY